MNRFEYAQFLAGKDKRSREHQQLMRDSKVGVLDLDKYKSKNPTKLKFEDYMMDLSWNQLRKLVEDNHQKEQEQDINEL